MTSVSTKTVVYRSAVDSWLLFALGGAMLTSGTACILVVMAGERSASVIALVACAIGVGLPLWILTSTSYTLTAEHLVVRSGPWRQRIPLADIRDIAPTSSVLSAPALSLQRLRIEYANGRSVVVSPAESAAFVADLNTRRSQFTSLNRQPAPGKRHDSR